MLEDSSNSAIRCIKVSDTKPDNKKDIYKTIYHILQTIVTP